MRAAAVMLMQCRSVLHRVLQSLRVCLRPLACWRVYVRRRAEEADEWAQGAEGLGQGGCCKGKGGTEAATQSLCVAVLSDVAVRAAVVL